MAKLVVTAFVTLDGVMQAPGGPNEDRSGGFEHGGWVVPFVNEEFGASIVDIFSRADAFLLGRGTYDIFASHWPRVEDPNDPIAVGLNTLPKHIATRSPRPLDWKGSSAIEGDVVAAVAALKQRYPRELQVHGSPGLLQTLLATELVDDLHLFQFPVVLGRGKRLFEPGVAATAFALDRAIGCANGVVIRSYHRTGKPTYGAIGLET